MAQVAYDRGVILVPGMTVDVVCDCEWEGERTVYDIGDGPEWACPSCDWAQAPSADVLSDGSEAARKNMAVLVEKFGDRLPEWCRQPAVAEIRF